MPACKKVGKIPPQTTALEDGAQLEGVQKAAGHRDPSTTKLYDRRGIQKGSVVLCDVLSGDRADENLPVLAI